MKSPRASLVRGLWVFLVLVVGVGESRESAAQRRPAPSQGCPRRRPAEGSACAAPDRQCSWRCGGENEYDWSCRCAQVDGASTWRCTRGGLCGL